MYARNVARVVGLAIVVAVSVASPLSSSANERVTYASSPQGTTCRIDEPNVTRRLSTYPQVTLRPGDRVTVRAGGCVQTGGHGRTWKRYVNPSGPNSDRLYHGMIWIPGAHSDLVRIGGAIGRPIVVPAAVDPHNAVLRLGYEDDHYGDNGYWGHDDGTENQCRGVGNAFVELRITRGPVDGGPSAPFDLIFTAQDANGFPLNPQWACNETTRDLSPTPIRNASLFQAHSRTTGAPPRPRRSTFPTGGTRFGALQGHSTASTDT
jgi:hypothetical protein